jgi:hypothetical protein
MRSRHSLIIKSSQSLVSFGKNSSSTSNLFSTSTSSFSGLGRRPSVTPSFLSFVSYTTPPESPTYASGMNTSNEVLFSLNTKDIAKYLTLADFYILKCITAQDYLAMYHPRVTKKNRLTKTQYEEDDQKINYITMMTERANKLSQWVLMEVTAQKLHSKSRRIMIRKMIEIAKVQSLIQVLFLVC